jgi:hypothetical protein
MKRFLAPLLAVLLAATAWAEGNLSLPTGTSLKVKLENQLSTTTSRLGDPFSGRVMEAVQLDGKTVIPVGTTVQGRVTKVTDTRRLYGKPTIAIFPENIVLPDGKQYTLNAALVDTSVRNGTDVNEEGQFKGKGYDGKDLTEIGIGTGGGMLIGGLAGGGKGLLIGGAIGATATVAHWLSKTKSATLPAGTELWLELSRPLEMSEATAGQ